MAKHKRTKFYRRRIAILLTSMGFGILTGVLGVLYSNSSVTMHVSEGDVVLLPVSTFFCEGMEVKSHETKVKVSKMPYVPSISNNRWVYHSTHEFKMKKKEFRYWSAYLLKESVITVNVCSDDSVALFVFQGRGNFDRWKADNTYNEYIYQTETYGYHNCRLRRNHFLFELKVTEKDNYFFVYWHTAGVLTTATVSVSVAFNRTIYDTSRAAVVCDSVKPESSCYARLQYASYDVTMVEVLNTNSKADYFGIVKFTYHPRPRVWFYSALFGGIFGFFATAYLTLSLLSKILKDKVKNVGDEQEALIENDRTAKQRAIALEHISTEEDSPSLDDTLTVYSLGSTLNVNYRNRYESGSEATALNSTCITAGLSAV